MAEIDARDLAIEFPLYHHNARSLKKRIFSSTPLRLKKDVDNRIVIAALRDRGDMAIVLVEQFFDFAWDLGDDFLVLERGRAVMQGTKASLRRADLHARLAGHAAA